MILRGICTLRQKSSRFQSGFKQNWVNAHSMHIKCVHTATNHKPQKAKLCWSHVQMSHQSTSIWFKPPQDVVWDLTGLNAQSDWIYFECPVKALNLVQHVIIDFTCAFHIDNSFLCKKACLFQILSHLYWSDIHYWHNICNKI